MVRPYESEADFLQNELFTITRSSVVLVGAGPKPEGVVLRFEVSLRSGGVLLRGEGRVMGHGPVPLGPLGDEKGLALRFTRLDPRSKALVDRAVAMRDPARSSPPVAESEPALPVAESEPALLVLPEMGLSSVPVGPSPDDSREVDEPEGVPESVVEPALNEEAVTARLPVVPEGSPEPAAKEDAVTARPPPMTESTSGLRAQVDREALLSRLRARLDRLGAEGISRILSRS